MNHYYANYPDFDSPDAEMNDASCYDDRDVPGLNIDEQDGFNTPEERVAHL